MLWRLFANYSGAFLLFCLMNGWSFIHFSRATSTTNQSNVVKVLFILEESQQAEDLKTAFDGFLKKNASFPFVDVVGVTLVWKREDTPVSTWRKMEEIVVKENASAVVSFLSSWKNQVLVNALIKSVVPIIGIESLTKELYSNNKAGELYVSMLPTEALEARVLIDLLMDYEESRFTCITTESSRHDALLTYLSQYQSSDRSQTISLRRCIILGSGNLLEELSAGLAAISASGVRLIIVHCTSGESTEIISLIRKLNFKLLRGDFVWIFTSKAVGVEPKEFPRDAIGIQMTQKPGNGSMLELYQSLLNDSVRLFGKALEQSLWGLSQSARLTLLKGEQFTSYKRRLYREMIHLNFPGQTGSVQFSPNGERTSFTFTITTARRRPEGGLQWYVMGHDHPQMTPDYGPQVFEPFLPRDLPRPRHLRVVSINHEPFTVIHDVDYSCRLGISCPADTVPCTQFTSSDQNPLKTLGKGSANVKCCFGAMIDILIKLQEIEEFTYDLYLVADGKYGSVDPVTKQMNGMIGDVYRGFADLALGVITITEERSMYVGFTTPFMETALTFLVKRTKLKNKNFAESISDMRLMKSFDMELWFMCLAAFCTVAFSVWAIEKLYYYRIHKSSYLLPFEFVMYVYGNIFHVPLTRIQARSYSVPFVMVVANFAGLVLVSSYTANLLASLITMDDVNVVSGIGDEKLVDPPEGFTFGAIKDTSTEDFFRKSKSSRLRKIYENMENHNVKNFSDGIKKVISGELTAFVAESDSGTDDPNCTLKEDGIGFDLSGLAFALQKNSAWIHPLSRAIHKLKAEETIAEIFRKWTTSRCKNLQQTVVAQSMGLDEFGGFLFNTATICVGCFFILLIEIIFYRRIARTRQSFSPQQNGIALNAISLPEGSSMTSNLSN